MAVLRLELTAKSSSTYHNILIFADMQNARVRRSWYLETQVCVARLSFLQRGSQKPLYEAMKVKQVATEVIECSTC